MESVPGSTMISYLAFNTIFVLLGSRAFARAGGFREWVERSVSYMPEHSNSWVECLFKFIRLMICSMQLMVELELIIMMERLTMTIRKSPNLLLQKIVVLFGGDFVFVKDIIINLKIFLKFHIKFFNLILLKISINKL